MKTVLPPDSDAITALFHQAAGLAIDVLHQTGEYLPTVTLGSCPPGARKMLAHANIPPGVIRLMQSDDQNKAVLRMIIEETLNPASSVHKNASATLGAEINVVIHITEAWMSKPSDVRSYVPPSQDPDRTEALTVIIHTGRGTAIGVCPITRDEHGSPTAVVGDLIGNDGKLAGALVTNPLQGFSPPGQPN